MTSTRRRFSITQARTQKPSLAEVKAIGQPAEIFDRHSAEHWAGRLYMRRLSPHLTRALLPTSVSPNALTGLMSVVGLAAAALLSLNGLAAALGAVLLIQLQLLLDCSDGELARVRGQSSPAGIYLDRIGHYLTEAALPIGLGIRADGGWHSLGGWTTLGLVLSVMVLLIKSETVLVNVARAESGRAKAEDAPAVAAPRGGLLRRLRSALGVLPFYRAFVAVEFSLLAFCAAIADAAAGDQIGSRVLVIALLPVGAVTLVGHLVAILASDRLR
ncbi:MAG TPA: CDP-alcohol phosphatidyltransferase family protein [Thermoleophilaceae bacterium]